MRKNLLLLICLLCFVLPPARSQELEEDLTDLLEFDASTLQPRENQEILAAAHQAYAAGDFADAARSFILALKIDPGDSNSLYNLACCYGLLGIERQAGEVLTAAWKAGFTDLEHIQRDPDFERVRSGKEFGAAMARIEAEAEQRARSAGKKLEVVCPVVADVRVLAPEGLSGWQRYPLVIGLHGLGDNGENFARLFANREIEQPFIYCAVQAPYPFATQRGLGYSWTLREPGASVSRSQLSQRLSAKFVLSVIEAVKREYPVDERNVFLLGFSQGAGMAFSVGMQHPGAFKGVIPVGGWLSPGEHPADRVRKAAKEGLFFVCHAVDDQVVPYDRAREAVKFLEENRIPYRLREYTGGHSLPKTLVAAIAEWMQAPTAGAPRQLEEVR